MLPDAEQLHGHCIFSKVLRNAESEVLSQTHQGRNYILIKCPGYMYVYESTQEHCVGKGKNLGLYVLICLAPSTYQALCKCSLNHVLQVKIFILWGLSISEAVKTDRKWVQAHYTEECVKWHNLLKGQSGKGT